MTIEKPAMDQVVVIRDQKVEKIYSKKDFDSILKDAKFCRDIENAELGNRFSVQIKGPVIKESSDYELIVKITWYDSHNDEIKSLQFFIVFSQDEFQHQKQVSREKSL